MTLQIREWDGTTIKEPGLYSGIPLEQYHNDQSLLPGPSVSKSSLKAIAPPDGSPKQFWQTWAGNPRRVKSKSSKAMDFGKAVHALILGDEVFEEKFVIRPEKVEGETYHANKKVWRDWFAQQSELGLTVITEEQIEQIRLMAEDLAQHPLVVAGGLNGQVEVSMFARDPVTGIWLKSRPDNLAADGVYVDLKTAGSLDQQFLERQFHDAGYYLQPAMTKMVCDLLGIPFQSFTFLYTLTDGYADSDFRVAYEGDILLGEKVIRYGLAKIRHGLDTGEWPGVSTYSRENLPIGMNDWSRKRIETVLQQEGFSQ
jgi:hypothetical protein